MSSQPARRLNALTALRFFAAAAVVVYHSKGAFGLPADVTAGERIPLFQGVSFFFVLSGFILTYVYPGFDSASGVARFLWTRFARLWPAHALAFGVWLGFAQTDPVEIARQGRLLPMLANLGMVHTWVPYYDYYASNQCGNVVSWSVSTEFGFYLLFPLLVWRFGRTWPVALAATLGAAAAVIAVCDRWNLPPEAPRGLTLQGLLYEHPLARVFEFALGMTAAHFYRAAEPRYRPGLALGTAAELAAFGLVGVNAYFTLPLSRGVVSGLGLTPSVRLWFAANGVICGSFAVLIFVCAMERGLVTRALARPWLVRLGEISYSVYLLHAMMLGYLWTHPKAFQDAPGWAVGIGFWAVLLSAAHLSFAFVEQPGRRLLMGVWPEGRRTPAAVPPGPGRPRWAVGPARAGWLLAAAEVGLILWVAASAREQRPYRLLSPEVAGDFGRRSSPGLRDIRFGDRYILRGANVAPTEAGLRLDLVWESCRRQPLDGFVAVHLCDDRGTMLDGADYPQDPSRRELPAGAVWLELTTIASDKLRAASKRGMTCLAIGSAVYDPPPGQPNLLAPDRGPLDSYRLRLIIPLPGERRAGLAAVKIASDRSGVGH